MAELIKTKTDTKLPKLFYIFLPIIIFKVLLSSDWSNRIKPKDYLSKSNTLFVLGNGPSIREQLEKYSVSLGNYDCICVNHFADSNYFTLIKPRFYVFIDPYFFDFNAHENYVIKREETFKSLNHNVLWHMTLFVPDQKSKKFIKSHIFNSEITIQTFNSNGISHRFEPYLFYLFKLNLASIVGHNVLVTAIYLGLVIGYKDVIILGGDHSWLESLYVDSSDNVTYINKKHFYGEEKEPWYSSSRKEYVDRLDSILYLISLTFRSHIILNDFANYLGAKIRNASLNSWIDAYERVKIESIL